MRLPWTIARLPLLAGTSGVVLLALLAACNGSDGRAPGGAATVDPATGRGNGAGEDRTASGAWVRGDGGRDQRSFMLPRRSTGTEPACTAVVHVRDLPGRLNESSGLAASRSHPGILWTHNDSGGEAAVYALDQTGVVVGKVAVRGARNLDWEDIALGPCTAGRAGDCLYIGDIGDNDRRRPDITVYRVPEPAPSATTTAPAQPLTFRYPDGPHDAEALFVLPDGSINIVTKGRDGPATLYRAGSGAHAAAAELSQVQLFSVGKPTIDRAVTGADASADGRWVAVRSYAWLQLYHPDASGVLHATLPAPGLPLEDAGEPQGEAVALGSGGTIWLTTEGGRFGGHPFLTRLACRLP